MSDDEALDPLDCDEETTRDDTLQEFKCQECEKVFEKKLALTRHLRNVHSTHTWVTCEHCKESYSKRYIVQHMRKHTGEKPYNCPECGKDFADHSTRAKHRLQVHRVGDVSKIKKTCTVCGKVLSNYQNLWRHMRLHLGVKPHKCTECDKSFAEPSALKAHISATHREGENEFPCEFCGKVIKGKSNLIRHMRTHVVGVVEEFTCQVCGKVVKGEGNFKYHIKSHTEEKKFECSVCQKKFREKSVLVEHTRIHTGERPFQCKHCDKSFGSRSTLRKHVTIHSGERPHECDICHKTFRDKGSLQSHMSLVHSDKKTFGCPICSKWFKTRAGCANHRDLIHNSKAPLKRRSQEGGRGDDQSDLDCSTSALPFTSSLDGAGASIQLRECSVALKMILTVDRAAERGCRTFSIKKKSNGGSALVAKD